MMPMTMLMIMRRREAGFDSSYLLFFPSHFWCVFFLGACFEVFPSMGLSLIVALPAFSQSGVRIQVLQCFTGCCQARNS